MNRIFFAILIVQFVIGCESQIAMPETVTLDFENNFQKNDSAEIVCVTNFYGLRLDVSRLNAGSVNGVMLSFMGTHCVSEIDSSEKYLNISQATFKCLPGRPFKQLLDSASSILISAGVLDPTGKLGSISPIYVSKFVRNCN